MEVRTIDEIEVVPVFTQEDFLTGTAPYEFVYQYKDNRFAQGRILNIISINAEAVKVKNFKGLYKEYEKSRNSNSLLTGNTTQFDGQEIELYCDKWIADEGGVSTYMGETKGEVYACVHPILPVQRLVNIDADYV